MQGHSRRRPLTDHAAADVFCDTGSDHRERRHRPRRRQPIGFIVPRRVRAVGGITGGEGHRGKDPHTGTGLTQVLCAGPLLSLQIKQAVSAPQRPHVGGANRELLRLAVDDQKEACVERVGGARGAGFADAAGVTSAPSLSLIAFRPRGARLSSDPRGPHVPKEARVSALALSSFSSAAALLSLGARGSLRSEAPLSTWGP